MATIFYNHCTRCHHNGGGAPFSLMNFSEAAVWPNSIYTAINRGIMPPWQPDTAYIAGGNTSPRFLHENVHTINEKTAILNWVTDGALQGDSALVPEVPKYGEMVYKLNGDPGLTLKIPDFYTFKGGVTKCAF